MAPVAAGSGVFVWREISGREVLPAPSLVTIVEFDDSGRRVGVARVPKVIKSLDAWKKELPVDRLLTNEFVDYATEKLGPFRLENTASTLPGCR